MSNWRVRIRYHHYTLIVALIVATGCGSSDDPPSRSHAVQASAPLVPSALSAPEPAVASNQQRVPLPVPRDSRFDVAIDRGLLWLATSADQRIVAIDLATATPQGPAIDLDLAPVSIAAGHGSLWVVGLDHRHLVRIDPLTRQTVATIEIGAGVFPEYEHLWLAAGEGSVWLVGQRQVAHIDPRTNRRVGEPITAGEEIICFALGAGSLWTGSHDDGILARIDPATGTVAARIAMDFSIHGLAVADGAAWVLDEHGFRVVRVDAATNALSTRIPIDFVAANLAAGEGTVWVAAAARNNGPTGMDWVARIDTATEREVGRVRVGGAPESEYNQVRMYDGEAWVVVTTPQPYIVRLPP